MSVRIKGRPYQVGDKVQALCTIDSSPAGIVHPGTKGTVYMIRPACRGKGNSTLPSVLGVHWQGVEPKKGFHFSLKNEASTETFIKKID